MSSGRPPFLFERNRFGPSSRHCLMEYSKVKCANCHVLRRLFCNPRKLNMYQTPALFSACNMRPKSIILYLQLMHHHYRVLWNWVGHASIRRVEGVLSSIKYMNEQKSTGWLLSFAPLLFVVKNRNCVWRTITLAQASFLPLPWCWHIFTNCDAHPRSLWPFPAIGYLLRMRGRFYFPGEIKWSASVTNVWIPNLRKHKQK